MNAVICCEESATVRDELLDAGHNAWSCDLLPCGSDKYRCRHIQDDARKVLSGKRVLIEDLQSTLRFHPKHWDFIGVHVPCTDLAVSGARWATDHWVKNKKGDRWHDGSKKRANQKLSIEFFMFFVQYFEAHPKVMGYIEQPISIMSTHYRKPDQIIQPYDFGHKVTKQTCLWLFNLSPLVGTGIPGPPKNDEEKKEYLELTNCPPGPDRAKIRSRTFPGIAAAFAAQWGNLK